jgi:hypothetical protein
MPNYRYLREVKVAIVAAFLGVFVSFSMLALWESMPQPISEPTRETFLQIASLLWPAWRTMFKGTVPSNPMTFYYHYYVPWIRTPFINGIIYAGVAFGIALMVRMLKKPTTPTISE